MNTPHDPGEPYDDAYPWDDETDWPTNDDPAATADGEHWWPRVVDRINSWWVNHEPTGPALADMATIPPKRAIAALLAAVLAVVSLAGFLLWWLVSGIVGIASGIAEAIRTSSGQHTTTAVHDLTSWTITRTITDPVHTYLSAHTAGLPVTADLAWWTWLASSGALFVLAAFGSRGARIGWAITGGLTTAMVYTATPAIGRSVAAGLTVTAWAVLSVIAYNRLAPLDHPVHIRIPLPHRPTTADTTD